MSLCHAVHSADDLISYPTMHRQMCQIADSRIVDRPLVSHVEIWMQYKRDQTNVGEKGKTL